MRKIDGKIFCDFIQDGACDSCDHQDICKEYKKMKKLTVVGRHQFDAKEAGFEGWEIDQKNLTFPTVQSVIDFLWSLDAPVEENVTVLFQMTFANLAQAIVGFHINHNGPRINVGLIKSKASPELRPGPQVIEMNCSDGNNFNNADEVQALLKFVNPRAIIDRINDWTIQVKVEAPMPFKFDGIEWVWEN